MINIFSYWQIDPLNFIFAGLLVFLYLYIHHFRPGKKAAWFFSGWVIYIVAIASPIAFLADHFLFSAQMTAHVMILLLAAPLMVIGISNDNRFKKQLDILSKFLNRFPIIAWLTGVGIMWFWHIPYIYQHVMGNAMMHSTISAESIMFAHHASLLLSGFIFCWPVVSPNKSCRINALAGVLYLAVACVFCSLLGLLITFAPAGFYAMHAAMPANIGFQGNIQNNWGITQADDQQMAGLIMWVPCCFIYLSGAMILLKKWMDEKAPLENNHSLHVKIN